MVARSPCMGPMIWTPIGAPLPDHAIARSAAAARALLVHRGRIRRPDRGEQQAHVHAGSLHQVGQQGAAAADPHAVGLQLQCEPCHGRPYVIRSGDEGVLVEDEDVQVRQAADGLSWRGPDLAVAGARQDVEDHGEVA